MQAAIRYRGPRDVRLASVQVPTIRPGGVLIEVKAAALCHTELHFADGTLQLGVQPLTLGHEASGNIVAVGDGVDPNRVGERVLAYYYVGCGKPTCPHCATGDEQLCSELTAQFGFISGACPFPSSQLALPWLHALHKSVSPHAHGHSE